jgi:hypothetical protein
MEDLHDIFGVASQDEREELFDMIYDELDMHQDFAGEAA